MYANEVLERAGVEFLGDSPSIPLLPADQLLSSQRAAAPSRDSRVRGAKTGEGRATATPWKPLQFWRAASAPGWLFNQPPPQRRLCSSLTGARNTNQL